MYRASDTCLKFCEELCIPNDIGMWLMYETNAVYNFLHGDSCKFHLIPTSTPLANSPRNRLRQLAKDRPDLERYHSSWLASRSQVQGLALFSR